MRTCRRTRSGNDRNAERRQRRLEKLRRLLPQAAVSRCEASSEGDQLLHALECLDAIVRNPIFPLRLPLAPGGSAREQGVSAGLVGTINHPVNGMSTESQLDTLIEAILRESSARVPNLRGKMLIAFAKVAHDADSRKWRSTSPVQFAVVRCVIRSPFAATSCRGSM